MEKQVTPPIKSVDTPMYNCEEYVEELKLSVIIPVFNPGPYLVPCLDSVRTAIQGINAEVICVDDGSDDGNDRVLDEYAEKNPQFRIYHTAHTGAGGARNYGAPLAKGKYMAFVDADDLVAESLYRDMLYLCETHNVPLCVCNISRFEDSGRGVVSGQYQRVFAGEPKIVTSLEEKVSFIYDGSPCNKMIRRDFWMQHEFVFPADIHHEDMPVFLKMFTLADRFAVLQSFGYLWRVRPGGVSMSQQVDSVKSLENRIEICRMSLQILDDKFGPESVLSMAMQKRFLNWDFDAYVWNYQDLDEETKRVFIDKLRRFFAECVTEKALENLPVFHLARYESIMKGDVENLVRLMNHRRMAWRTAPILEKDGKQYLKLPEDIYGREFVNPTLELEDDIPVTRLTYLGWQGTKATMNIVVYQPRVNVSEPDSQSIKVFLYNEHTGQRIYVPCTPLKVEPWTKRYGQMVCQDDYKTYRYNYDYAGITLTVDFEEVLKEDRESREILARPLGVKPRWLMFIEYDNGVLQGVRPLRGINPNPKKAMETMNMVVEQDGEKYRYNFVQDIRQTLYIEMEKA